MKYTHTMTRVMEGSEWLRGVRMGSSRTKTTMRL